MSIVYGKWVSDHNEEVREQHQQEGGSVTE